MGESAFPDIANLIAKGADEVKAWLQQIWVGNSDLPRYGNWWLGLADSIRSKVFREEPPNLEWAQIAVSIYESMNRYTPGGCEGCMLSSMMFRAKLICMLGTKQGDSILNIETIVSWFLENLPMTREEAAGKIQLPLKQLADNHMDDLTALRRIKNRLAVLKTLSDRAEIQSNTEIKEWLGLRDKLP